MTEDNSPKNSPEVESFGDENFNILPRAKSAMCADGIRSFSDLIRLETEQVRQLKEYIVGDKLKRPSVIKFKVYWKLCSQRTVGEEALERFEAAYINGTAFAITPKVLLTARHIFRPPTAQEVLLHFPDMKERFKEIEECVKLERWVISAIKWCADDSDAGYELSEVIVLGSDFVVLKSLEKEHHRLALAIDEPGQRCWSIQVDDANGLQFWAGTWNWKEIGVKGATTCFIGDGYSGSPLLNVEGHVIGLITHTVGGLGDTILGRFYGSSLLLRCIFKCFPEILGELKSGNITEEPLPDRFVHWARIGSVKDYTRALSSNDPGSDDDAELERALKRQRRHPKVRRIGYAISGLRL